MRKSQFTGPRSDLFRNFMSFHQTIVEEHAPMLLHWRSPLDTQRAAQRLALCPEVSRALIFLHGPLGAGKSTFARYLLQALGVTGVIKSPTYALVETYAIAAHSNFWGEGFEAVHADLYRMQHGSEWEDAGLREMFDAPGLKLVEWPEKAQGKLPSPHLEVWLQFDATAGQEEGDWLRRVKIQAHDSVGEALIQAVGAAASL